MHHVVRQADEADGCQAGEDGLLPAKVWKCPELSIIDDRVEDRGCDCESCHNVTPEDERAADAAIVHSVKLVHRLIELKRVENKASCPNAC